MSLSENLAVAQFFSSSFFQFHPHYWKIFLNRYRILGWTLSFSSTWKISFEYILAFIFTVEMSTVSLLLLCNMYIIYNYFLTAFRFFSLSLVSYRFFFYAVSLCWFPFVYPVWIQWASWKEKKSMDWALNQLWKVSSYSTFKYFHYQIPFFLTSMKSN